MNIVIIDYGVGNVKSLINAFSRYCDVKLTNKKEDILNANGIVLPGVGSFESAMKGIDKYNLRDILVELKDKKYFLGVCLGLQIMFEESEESPGIKGLGFFEGKVEKLIQNNNLKLPNIGWSVVDQDDEVIFKNIECNSDMYFCHSYYVPSGPWTLANTYFGNFPFDSSIVFDERIFGTQFHPEKSGKKGLTLIENFVTIVNIGIGANNNEE